MLNESLDATNIFSAWGSLIGILFLIILSAFFSGSETALTASSRAKLRSMTDRGSKGAKKALDIHGYSVSSSALISGYSRSHMLLEEELSNFLGQDEL